MTCVFCDIVAGRVPAARVLDDERCVAFLDTRPLFKGHTLLVPRRHVATVDALTPDELGPYFTIVQQLVRAVEQALSADGSFVAINNKVSQSVPHLHTHIVPRRRKDGLRGFFWPRQHYAGAEEQTAVALAITRALNAIS